MQFKYFVGIDVSKGTLDFSLAVEGKIQRDLCVENSAKGIKNAIYELSKKNQISLENTLFCMEQTGLYNNHVTSILYSLKAFIWVEKAIQIKRSCGLQRGKSDKVDAQRIAMFAYRNQDQKKLWEPKRIIIQQLKKLTTVRERLLLTIAQLQKPI